MDVPAKFDLESVNETGKISVRDCGCTGKFPFREPGCTGKIPLRECPDSWMRYFIYV